MRGIKKRLEGKAWRVFDDFSGFWRVKGKEEEGRGIVVIL